MSKSDQAVVVIMLLLVVLYLAVWATGYFTGKLPVLMAVLNAATAVSILGYWVLKQLRIQQHFIELREVLALGTELLIAAMAIYMIVSGSRQKWLTVVQYTVFGIHLLVLVVGIVFMFTFKMNKLM